MKHQIYQEWGIGNVYDVMPQTDMALVAFENVDTVKYGSGPVRRKWYPLDHLGKDNFPEQKNNPT
ncbi:hypothetical protein [Paenibacillus sp. IHBB 10380]|uniref:hypothetical protein n=1 Tax=Paenibacillus sp. IHBB 10380 TaxID=1566358 RepID=UPI0005CF9841|nr:hypothetical protein [Paenibacillus sp. IHBB 10380]AJS59979.1 hypothetical protein UB51_17580 [Paenibacillus sp. IHBB 10380]